MAEEEFIPLDPSSSTTAVKAGKKPRAERIK
jgi:hypothetical protein